MLKSADHDPTLLVGAIPVSTEEAQTRVEVEALQALQAVVAVRMVASPRKLAAATFSNVAGNPAT